MPTANYNLPTIGGEEAVNIVGDMNALANATDAALKKVSDEYLEPYTLPTASRTVKGGVIVGDGLYVSKAGVLSTYGDGSELSIPIATSSTLGGVKVGDGLAIDRDGVLSVAERGVPANSVTTGTIANGAVTTDKLAASAVTSDKLAGESVTNDKLSKAVAQDMADTKAKAEAVYNGFNGSPVVAGSLSSGSGGIETWGKLVILHLNAINVPSASRTLVGNVTSAFRPRSETVGTVAALDGSEAVVGFIRVDTAGNVYINPGNKSNLTWDGTLVYAVG